MDKYYAQMNAEPDGAAYDCVGDLCRNMILNWGNACYCLDTGVLKMNNGHTGCLSVYGTQINT